jgi:hypothetical protein
MCPHLLNASRDLQAIDREPIEKGSATMQPVVLAEQTSRSRYPPAEPLPPREIELTVRLIIPEAEGADVGIRAEFVPGQPARWEDGLYDHLYRGVHGGLAGVDSPLPTGGIDIEITRVRLWPPLDIDSDDDDVHRVDEALEALASASVRALWTGLIRFGVLSAA